MDAAQWPQQHQQVAGYSRAMEEIAAIPNNNNPTNNINNNNNSSRGATQVVGDQRKARPQKDQNVNCPRCNSTNTKFCYYNNYSLTQPRYFCKTCRRYWTQGGSLRNVPVGGGSRKNKRSITTSTNPNPTNNNNNNKLIPDLNPHLISASHQNPKFLQGQDLNLAFPMQGIFHQHNNENHEPLNIINTTSNNNNNSNLSSSATNNNTCSSTTTTSTPISALELLRTGMASRGSLNPYVPMPMPMPDSSTLYPSGFPNLQEFKPNMNVFSGDHHSNNNNNNMVGSGDNNNNNVGSDGGNNGAARLLFPFADMNKLASSTPGSATTPHHHHHHQIDDQTKDHHQPPTNGYWSGMLGGGTW